MNVLEQKPITTEFRGHRYTALPNGYDIVDAKTGALVKFTRSDCFTDVRTSAQRAEMWIAAEIEPRLSNFGA